MTRRPALHFLTFVVFFLALVFPWAAGLLGASSETVERRNPAPLPELTSETLTEVRTFASLNNYVRDRTPLRGPLTAGWNNIWLNFGVSSDITVVEGPGENLFLAEDFTRPCDRDYSLDELGEGFAELEQAAADGGKEFLFLVAPDKAAVLDDQLVGRANLAAACSRGARVELRDALDATGLSFDLAPMLIDAERERPGEWYYEHDSHWTFAAGDLVAGRIVDHFQDGLFNIEDVQPIDRSLPIRGDVFGRLGILRLRDEPDPFRQSIRPNVSTELAEEQIGGTRTIRTYRNFGGGQTIPGRTVVVHDSMMNFAELQLAAYFDEIVFIHWDDMVRAGIGEQVTNADRMIVLRVERVVNPSVSTLLQDAAPATGILRGLATPR